MIRSWKTWHFVICAILLIITGLFILNKISKPLPIEIEHAEESKWDRPLHLEPPDKNYQSTLFNLTLHYVVAPVNCTPDLLAIIVVTSYYGNVETRSSMRRALSRQDLSDLKLKRVFLLGEAPKDNYTKQAAILDEAKRFGDILQGNFLESYRNLTYKHLMGLKWASDRCFGAKYVIKMDDDIVIDVIKVVAYLQRAKLPKNLLAGFIFRGMTPIREPANKWYVSEREYPHKTYPPFLSGWFYVTTPQMASKFVLLSHYTQYFWIDDLYVTGLLARQLKVAHFDMGAYFAVHSELLQCCLGDFKKFEDCDFWVGPNGGDPDMFFKFAEASKLCDGGRCTKRIKKIEETCVAPLKTNLKRGQSIIEKYRLH